MKSGASRPPAVTGSITIDSNGMPTMAKPPPNAPRMKLIRNTPARATRIVATVSSMSASRGSDRSLLRRRIVPDVGRQLVLERGVHGVAEQLHRRKRAERDGALHDQ